MDAYSAFYENDRKTPTGLTGYLKERGLIELYFAGLATDFCVHDSAVNAARLGFAVRVIEDACRGIDRCIKPGHTPRTSWAGFRRPSDS